MAETPMDSVPDRRKHRRVHLVQTVLGTIGLSRSVRVVNLSLAGAMVEHAHPLAPGQPCILDLPGQEGEVHIRAHVVWSQLFSVSSGPERAQEQRYRSGIAFTADSREAAALLREWMG